MKSVTISELKSMKAPEIKGSGCFRLTADGEVIAIIMVTPSAEKKDQLEALASQINSALGV